MKVLEWKLKQRDEEIAILLKRIQNMEERTQTAENFGRRERIMTSDSIENYYSHKNNKHIS